MVKKRRKISAKQAAALKKGREKLIQKRKGRTMDGRKKRSGRRRSQVVIVNDPGIEGRRRKRSRRRGGYYMGAMKAADVTTAAQDIGLTLVGAIIGSILSGKIPIKDPRIRAAIPTIAGIILSPSIKQPLLKHIVGGVAVGGGISLVRSLAPQLGLAGIIEEIQGAEELKIEEGLRKEIERMIEKPVSGLIQETAGEDEIEGEDSEVYTTQANL